MIASNPLARRPSNAGLAAATLCFVGCSLLGAACAPPGGPEPSHPAAEAAAAYDERAARLFDDAIEPAAVGLVPFPPSPRGDPTFRERVAVAETIARVRVTTVTADSIDGMPTYHVTLVALGPPLAGRELTDGRLELTITSASPAFGIARTLDAQLVGRAFVGFFHRFASGVESPLFFHLAADSADVVAAVEEAQLLGELSGR